MQRSKTVERLAALLAETKRKKECIRQKRELRRRDSNARRSTHDDIISQATLDELQMSALENEAKHSNISDGAISPIACPTDASADDAPSVQPQSLSPQNPKQPQDSDESEETVPALAEDKKAPISQPESQSNSCRQNQFKEMSNKAIIAEIKKTKTNALDMDGFERLERLKMQRNYNEMGTYLAPWAFAKLREEDEEKLEAKLSAELKRREDQSAQAKAQSTQTKKAMGWFARRKE